MARFITPRDTKIEIISRIKGYDTLSCRTTSPYLLLFELSVDHLLHLFDGERRWWRRLLSKCEVRVVDSGPDGGRGWSMQRPLGLSSTGDGFLISGVNHLGSDVGCMTDGIGVTCRAMLPPIKEFFQGY